MTRLLVSVRSAEEALAALAGGAEFIDVKEPNHGSLGAATSDIWREVVIAVNGRCVVSVAGGELSDDRAMPLPVNAWQGISLAKIGPAGTDVHWPTLWNRWRGSLPVTVEPVVVAYGDWEAAKAPPPEVILEHGKRAGCRWALIDTWQKNGSSLLELVSPHDIERWRRLAMQLDLQLVLAGSLSLVEIPHVAAWSPAAIAVRSAVCRGGRGGAVDENRVRTLATLIAEKSGICTAAAS